MSKDNAQKLGKRVNAIQLFGGVVAVAGALLLWGCKDQEHMADDHHEGAEDEHMMMEGDPGQHHGENDDARGKDAKTNELTGRLVDGVRKVEMKARKFEFDPAKVVVRQGEKVRLEVTSEDVAHGIGIAAYDIDKRLPPNETVTMEFTAGDPGTHHFHCSVYCGAGHDQMHGELVVLPAEE